MARPKITLYVDTVSPFAYLAYHILRHDAVFKGCSITYVPVFLGGIMNKCGNTPPIKVKNKDTYINTERLRWARYFSVPITSSLPPDFPAFTLSIMRALCYLEAQDARDAAAAAAGPQQQQQQQQREREGRSRRSSRGWSGRWTSSTCSTGARRWRRTSPRC
ncbi:hypothetical protein VTH06DRAFT_1453 [Thermothelomyces fergusii]